VAQQGSWQERGQDHDHIVVFISLYSDIYYFFFPSILDNFPLWNILEWDIVLTVYIAG